MARKPETELVFGDGAYLFRLKLKQIEELQAKCDAGPPEIMRRLMTNTWRIHDVREVIRLGLIGGGATPPRALELVKQYVDDEPIAPNVLIALSVMQARLFPFEDEPLGDASKKKTAEETTAASPSPESSVLRH